MLSYDFIRALAKAFVPKGDVLHLDPVACNVRFAAAVSPPYNHMFSDP